MRIRLARRVVDVQCRALDFRTRIHGFQWKNGIPMEESEWITIDSPKGPEEAELSPEPNILPAAHIRQEAIFALKIPLAASETTGIEADCVRLSAAGVGFLSTPQPMDLVRTALSDDTCGIVIQPCQPARSR